MTITNTQIRSSRLDYWEASSAGATISDALRTLSKRVGERGGKKIVFKMMYDRGTPKQVVENRQIVKPDTYTGDAVKLPAPSEIPNVDLEVMNYHRPVVGTFHAKYMVVDRKVAILQRCGSFESFQHPKSLAH